MKKKGEAIRITKKLKKCIADRICPVCGERLYSYSRIAGLVVSFKIQCSRDVLCGFSMSVIYELVNPVYKIDEKLHRE